MILLIILQLMMQPFTPDGVVVQSATDHEVWVWCNTCHQHLPEVNGVIKDWDPVTHQIVGNHAHQNGWMNNEPTPIDSHNTGIYFLLVLLAIYCFCLMVKPEKK